MADTAPAGYGTQVHSVGGLNPGGMGSVIAAERLCRSAIQGRGQRFNQWAEPRLDETLGEQHKIVALMKQWHEVEIQRSRCGSDAKANIRAAPCHRSGEGQVCLG